MFKAFLSHTFADKEFVEQVAKKLGRERAIFDKYTFPEGQDFRQSIMEYLEKTDLFVLFASKEALNASWVKYEIDNAELLIIEEKLKKGIVFLIGDEVSHKHLPKWCQKALVKNISSPSIVANIIEEKLLDINPNFSEVYIGRGNDRDKFSEHRYKTSIKNQVLVFYGLDGIGRRTFAKDILKGVYNLQLGPVFGIETAAELVNLYIDLKDHLEGFDTKEDYKAHIDAFNQLNLEQKIDEIIFQLNIFAENRISPCLLDQGGLMYPNGKYKNEYIELMRKINEKPNLYLTIIQSRNPYYVESEYDSEKLFFITYLKKLTDESMSYLLSTYLDNLNITYKSEHITEFTSYLDGYPPAAIFVRNLISNYGIDVALADKTMLSGFKAKKFTEYINKVVDGNLIKIKILRICEALPPLKYLDIKNICTDDNASLKLEIQTLIDQSAITVDLQNNVYTLASPLREAVRRNWGSLTKKEYAEIALKLKDEYWDNENLPSNDILETLIFCLLRAGNDEALKEFKDIIFPSIIIKAAESAYRNREWNEVIQLCNQALSINYDLDFARVMLVKSLVRENENPDSILGELKDRNHIEYYPLKGFRDLKRGKYRDALKSYMIALAKGIKTMALYREIAECYYRLDEYENATLYINKALERDSIPNKFVIDLAAKIAIEKLDFDKANEYLTELEKVDNIENVYHRKASLLSKQTNYIEAIVYAELACNRKPPLPETFLNKAFILIQLEKFKEARETLEEFRGNFKSYEKRDFYNELMCLVALNTNGWEEAEIYFGKLSSYSNFKQALKYYILTNKVEDKKINLVERESLRKELEELRQLGVHNFNSQSLLIKG